MPPDIQTSYASSEHMRLPRTFFSFVCFSVPGATSRLIALLALPGRPLSASDSASVHTRVCEAAGEQYDPRNMDNPASYFDRSAAQWDKEPRRLALTKAVGEKILGMARPTHEMDVLDYGCGTGLLGLFLLPHVRSVTGADSSVGMLEILSSKIREGRIANMQVVSLDLERQPVPEARFDMIVTSMVMHHVADVDRVLRAFHQMLRPGGVACVADLETEPNLFHPPEAAVSVHHHGFDPDGFMARMTATGLQRPQAITAYVVQKPVPGSGLRDFPIFLAAGWR